jgi:hypothetical protein
MDSDFVKPLVIGKAEKPRCFRNLNVDNLPVIWRSNKKAWMTSYLFSSWLSDFNRQMRIQGRHVLLFLDNAPSHPKDQVYSNVKLYFFPANTTSKLQPLDQGIIKCLKSHYRKRLLRKVISKVDQQKDASSIAKEINVYDACLWISQSQKCISSETVKKCFARCGFISDPEMDLPLQQWITPSDPELDTFLTLATDSLSLAEPMTAQEFTELDDSIPATEELGENWEAEIIQRAKGDPPPTTNEDPDDSELPDPEPELKLTTHQQTLDSLSQCELFGLEKSLPAEYLECIQKAQEILQRHTISVKSQAQQLTMDQFIRR